MKTILHNHIVELIEFADLEFDIDQSSGLVTDFLNGIDDADQYTDLALVNRLIDFLTESTSQAESPFIYEQDAIIRETYFDIFDAPEVLEQLRVSTKSREDIFSIYGLQSKHTLLDLFQRSPCKHHSSLVEAITHLFKDTPPDNRIQSELKAVLEYAFGEFIIGNPRDFVDEYNLEELMFFDSLAEYLPITTINELKQQLSINEIHVEKSLLTIMLDSILFDISFDDFEGFADNYDAIIASKKYSNSTFVDLLPLVFGEKYFLQIMEHMKAWSIETNPHSELFEEIMQGRYFYIKINESDGIYLRKKGSIDSHIIEFINQNAELYDSSNDCETLQTTYRVYWPQNWISEFEVYFAYKSSTGMGLSAEIADCGVHIRNLKDPDSIPSSVNPPSNIDGNPFIEIGSIERNGRTVTFFQFKEQFWAGYINEYGQEIWEKDYTRSMVEKMLKSYKDEQNAKRIRRYSLSSSTLTEIEEAAIELPDHLMDSLVPILQRTLSQAQREEFARRLSE